MPVSLFVRIWTSAKPRPIPDIIWQYHWLYLVHINVYAKFHYIFFTVLEIGPFSLFQSLELGKASTDKNCQLAISWATYCQYTNVYAKFHHNIQLSSRDRFFFPFFRIWSSAKSRPMKNDISQSLGLDLDSINVYAEVYQNIPLSSRGKVSFTFSEFGARQSLDRW